MLIIKSHKSVNQINAEAMLHQLSIRKVLKLKFFPYHLYVKLSK